jgi:hypothetical protein
MVVAGLGQLYLDVNPLFLYGKTEIFPDEV